MRLLSLSLENFRNYPILHVEFGASDAQLFAGPNGSGKTNLLEAISVLSLTKSCRGKDDDEMVMWERPFYRIKGIVESAEGMRHALEVVTEIVPRKRRAYFANDVRLPLSSMVGFLPTVTFLPQDLLLFSGPPAERRRFLDQLLSQVSGEYLEDVLQYQKILQQRNALLKRIAAGNERREILAIWDSELAAKGSVITLKRLELMETLNMSFAQELASLGEIWEKVELRYERPSVSRSKEALEEEMIVLLEVRHERDLLLQSTSVGPHREDWQVYRDGRSIPSFASRGQERVSVLALLLLEVSYLELKRGEKPVILLDDAFSELDNAHQTALLEGFTDYQVILTGTRVPDNARELTVFDVYEGMISAAGVEA